MSLYIYSLKHIHLWEEDEEFRMDRLAKRPGGSIPAVPAEGKPSKMLQG